jgi:tRNA threonylcarbamoyladenosine biosynthesis protein TsaE
MEAPAQRVFTCRRPEDLDPVAGELTGLLGGPRVVALYGQLGAGKTTLIKAICRHLGVRDTAASPTFAIIHEYLLADGDPVYHFDFYRIKSESEVFDLGYEHYFYSGRYCFVEWADKVEHLLPPGTARIRISVEEPARTLSLSL